jgi:hypothetical protein
MPKYRKMLTDWNAPYIQRLVRVMETQSKQTVANWVCDYAEEIMVPIWVKSYPKDNRPQLALDYAKKWLNKEVKLPEVKKIILECHQAAKENDANPAAQAAARAIGQSASTIHAVTHAVGLALYGALAVAYDELGFSASWEDLEKQAAIACDKMTVSLKKVAVNNEPNPAKYNWSC